MWECCQTIFVGWCLGTPLWYDLMDFWRAREDKCSMVLSILESLKARRRLQWGLFFVGSVLCPKRIKVCIGELAHPGGDERILYHW